MKKAISLSGDRGKWKSLWFVVLVLIVFLMVAGYLLFREYARTGVHFVRLRQYWADPERYSQWGFRVGDRCGGAPFLIPTDGFVAFFWGDRYSSGKKHQGVDIFSPEGPEGIGLAIKLPLVSINTPCQEIGHFHWLTCSAMVQCTQAVALTWLFPGALLSNLHLSLEVIGF
ncbi:MAG: hypothetical protein A2Z14_06700 [Chloroflexi bacterium RBG_16_48_8]|nr:MAG: hypothetical protein A2Z14_06700 [Chloroflexi bacterium RBG_16_48_8]